MPPSDDEIAGDLIRRAGGSRQGALALYAKEFGGLKDRLSEAQREASQEVYRAIRGMPGDRPQLTTHEPRDTFREPPMPDNGMKEQIKKMKGDDEDDLIMDGLGGSKPKDSLDPQERYGIDYDEMGRMQLPAQDIKGSEPSPMLDQIRDMKGEGGGLEGLAERIRELRDKRQAIEDEEAQLHEQIRGMRKEQS